MNVSVVIPVWNDAYTVKFCIESIAPYVDEVVAVDDWSTDGSDVVIHEMATRFPNVKYYKTEARRLCGMTRMLGLSVSTNKKVLFIDADDIFCGDYLRLKQITDTPSYVGLIDVRGDLNHIRMPYDSPWTIHRDACHVCVDLERNPGFKWGDKSSYVDSGPLALGDFCFWHLQGVKPDDRMVNRMCEWYNKAGSKEKPTLVEVLNSQKLCHFDHSLTELWPDCLKSESRFELQFDETYKVIGRTDNT